MDDDAVVKDTRKGGSGFRALEGFLESHQPAVVGLLQDHEPFLERTEKFQESHHCSSPKADYLGGIHFDAIVNAFHYKAVTHLLPYITDYDSNTWYASQMGLIVRTEILFRGQFVYHRYIKVSVSNPQHRPYKRDTKFDRPMFNRFTHGLDAYPSKGCNPECAKILVWGWQRHAKSYAFNAPALCLPIPPAHDPVEPCRYQCSGLGLGV
jgi:hypothetical protein